MSIDTSKLVKLLRMLTSSHDGEVLAAVARINGMVAGAGVDWADLVRESEAGLTEEQVRRVYEEGLAEGVEIGKRRAQPSSGRLWQDANGASAPAKEAGAKSFDVLEDVMEAAKQYDGQLTAFELDFCESMRSRISVYGARTFVSPKQWAVIERMKDRFQSKGWL